MLLVHTPILGRYILRTIEETTHLSRVAALGCIVCRKITGKYVPAEIHHIRSGTGMALRAHYSRTLPLCPRHHRTGSYGEAYHAGAKVWTFKFGSEEELLAAVRQELARLEAEEEAFDGPITQDPPAGATNSNECEV